MTIKMQCEQVEWELTRFYTDIIILRDAMMQIEGCEAFAQDMPASRSVLILAAMFDSIYDSMYDSMYEHTRQHRTNHIIIAIII